MHFRDAQAAQMPPVTNVVPLRRDPMSAERQHIENKIREHERAIANHAQQIRWLKLELETA